MTQRRQKDFLLKRTRLQQKKRIFVPLEPKLQSFINLLNQKSKSHKKSENVVREIRNDLIRLIEFEGYSRWSEMMEEYVDKLDRETENIPHRFTLNDGVVLDVHRYASKLSEPMIRTLWINAAELFTKWVHNVKRLRFCKFCKKLYWDATRSAETRTCGEKRCLLDRNLEAVRTLRKKK